MLEKYIDDGGRVWFKNDFLPMVGTYFTAKMLVDGCRCAKVPIPYMKLPPEICRAVKAEVNRQFNTMKMPIRWVKPVSPEDLI